MIGSIYVLQDEIQVQDTRRMDVKERRKEGRKDGKEGRMGR